jgi:two-component system response regulator
MTEEALELLLVEDNPSDAELTLHVLKKYNLANRIKHLRDGAEALQFLFGADADEARPAGTDPKLILLDLKLPRVNGLELLERLKADPRTRSIPVVVLTSSRAERDLVATYKLGVNSYVVKPVDFVQFKEALQQIGAYWLGRNELPKFSAGQ